MARTDTLSHFLTDVADAIRTKSGSQGTIQASSFDTAISNIPSGGDTPEAEEKDVNFYDYDGKRVYSYTKTEFLALNEYPANPTHQGLTAQGWNWDYQDAVDYVTEYGILDVGQMYTTSDGATRITAEIPETLRNEPCINFKLTGDVEIDWGDSSQVETATGSSFSQITKTHTYSPGKYTISITPLNDAQIKIGEKFFSGNSSLSYYSHYAYKDYVKEINIGNNVSFEGGAFSGFFNNDFILSLPSYITGFGGNSTLDCDAKILILPKNASSFGQYCYGRGANLNPLKMKIIFNGNIGSGLSYNQTFMVGVYQNRVIIPDTFTAFGNGAKYYGAVNLVMPKTITSINEFYLQNCKVLDFSHHESIPTLQSNQPFGSNFPADCQIVVPDSLYEDWIATNRWSNYASQIISKSDFDNQ